MHLDLSPLFFTVFLRSVFLQSIQLSQDVPVSLFLSYGPKNLPGLYVFCLWMILMCLLLITLFFFLFLSSLLITWPKKLAWCLRILFMDNLDGWLLVALFLFTSIQSIQSSHRMAQKVA